MREITEAEKTEIVRFNATRAVNEKMHELWMTLTESAMHFSRDTFEEIARRAR